MDVGNLESNVFAQCSTEEKANKAIKLLKDADFGNMLHVEQSSLQIDQIVINNEVAQLWERREHNQRSIAMTTIICYLENNIPKWEETELAPFQWKYANPNKTMQYAFEKNEDAIEKEDNVLKNWQKYAGYYGFSPKDRNAVFRQSDGHKMQLIQFLPKNKKYKCQVKDLDTGKNYKMTPSYVKRQLETSIVITT